MDAVTPSVHLGVSESLAVTPGHGLGLRQRLGWKKVCGTEWSGIWVLKGESRGYALPSTLDHLGVVWMEKRTYSTAWVTPTHACLCPYKYGRGAAVGPQSCSSIWNGVMGLWGRVAPLLTPWCSLRELPTGVNLNRYAGWGSSIPWHSDDEPLFGDQGDPKVIVSMSLGSSVDFRVRSRGRCNAPSSIRLDHGDLLVMDGLAQLEYEHSTSSELSGPRVNLTYRWISQHTPTCRSLRAGVCCALPSCAQGLPGLSSREGGGAFLMPQLGWLFLWLVIFACLVLACASITHWGWLRQRRCRVSHCCPTLSRSVSPRGQARWIGGRRWKMPRRRRLSQRWTRKFPSWGKLSWGKKKSFLILFKNKKWFCARVAQGDPTQSSDDTHKISKNYKGAGEEQGQKQYKTCRSSRGIWGLFTEIYGKFTFPNLRRFWGVILWMMRIGEARHPGPRSPPSSSFSIEYINVGGWLSNGDSPLESPADFLAVTEHRLIPARARSVTNSLRVSSGIVSVWAPACQDSIPGGHAGVGVVSMKGAPITLPTFATPEFSEFFRLGRAMRVILPLANGIIAHLFVVYGYQGSTDDPHKLSLTNKLLEAVIGEARVCGVGQPVIIAGDFNTEPSNIPVIAKALYGGDLVDLESAFAAGKGASPSPTCRFDLDGAPGTRRDFFLVSPNALSAATECSVLVDRWFRPHFAISATFGIGAWSAVAVGARACSSLAPASWLNFPDRSRYSVSKAVQDVWGVYLDMLQFVPLETREQLHKACLEEPNVDAAWHIWCKAAENGLLCAYKAAGGPQPQGDLPFLGRGKAVFRNRLLGGRAPGRVHRPAKADPIDSANCFSFINSSLAPVVLFRRRLSSVGDVLKGIRKNGFSTARWQALILRWAAVCRQGPTGPVVTLDPWRDWLPPDLHGFFAWVFDTLKVLDDFICQVTLARKRLPFFHGKGG